jgi:hypothetical protein
VCERLDISDSTWGGRLRRTSTRHSQAGCNSKGSALTVNAHLGMSSLSCLMGIRATAMHGTECLRRDVNYRLVIAAISGTPSISEQS